VAASIIMKKILFTGILLFGGFFLLFQAAIAQEGIGIAISPLVFEITGNPGEVIENQVKVTNKSQAVTDIKITLEDIAPSDEEGHVTVEPAETETYSVASWVKTTPQKFTLQPDESVWVQFTITIPRNAEPGGHYGSIVAAGSMISGGQITGAAIIPRVGALLLISVPGEAKEILTAKDFDAPIYSEYGPITFSAKFVNEGTVHLKPNALITVTNWLGQKVATASFPQKNVLPGATRKIEAKLDQKWFWAGKYTATLTGTYGTDNNQLEPVVIAFWAFPWKFGLLILGGLFLLLLMRKRLFIAFKILLKGDKR
jgi:hypothetical protein